MVMYRGVWCGIEVYGDVYGCMVNCIGSYGVLMECMGM